MWCRKEWSCEKIVYACWKVLGPRMRSFLYFHLTERLSRLRFQSADISVRLTIRRKAGLSDKSLTSFHFRIGMFVFILSSEPAAACEGGHCHLKHSELLHTLRGTHFSCVWLLIRKMVHLFRKLLVTFTFNIHLLVAICACSVVRSPDESQEKCQECSPIGYLGITTWTLIN